MEPELTCMDYLTRPVTELVAHPRYSQYAMVTAIALSELTTKQLETLKIEGAHNE